MSDAFEFRTILIIDDSDIVLEACRAPLEQVGYRVILRNRPSGSITAILNEKPDVVLLDLNMPTLSGEAILKVLGKSQNRPDTMVLLHSSLPLDTLRLKAAACGAHGYVQKTENSHEFLRRVEYWIKRPRIASSAHMRAAAVGTTFEATITENREPTLPSPRPVATRTLPSPEQPKHPPSSARVMVSTSSTKTLFVDDDWTTLNTYKTAFAAQLDAEYVSSGEEAIARVVSSTPPDIVVCDLVMPFLTGADVYRRALAYDRSWSSRFVFVTGAASQRSVAEFLNGIDAKMFFKPVPCERLLEAIRRLEAHVPPRNS